MCSSLLYENISRYHLFSYWKVLYELAIVYFIFWFLCFSVTDMEKYWKIILDFAIFLTVFSSNSVCTCVFYFMCTCGGQRLTLGVILFYSTIYFLIWGLSLHLNFAVFPCLTCQDLPFSAHQFWSTDAHPYPPLAVVFWVLGIWTWLFTLSNCSRRR